MIEDAGLPRMRVLSQRKLKELGRIPRSNEDKQEDALDAVIRCGADSLENSPKAIIFFYSHRWKRGNWCEELQKDMAWGSAEREQAMKEGKIFGDPDDAEHSKAKALIAYGEWFKRARLDQNFPMVDLSDDDDLEIFWWIDWCCTDQDKLLPKRSADEPGRDARPDIAALPAYAAVSAGIVAAWTPEYPTRPWCRAELLLAYAFTGKSVLVVPWGVNPQARGSPRWPAALA